MSADKGSTDILERFSGKTRPDQWGLHVVRESVARVYKQLLKRQELLGVFRKTAETCKKYGTSISKLALQFSSQNKDIPTTMFSTSNPQSVLRNIEWFEESVNLELVVRVQEVLAPVMNRQWVY